jgi:hypothetical protein
MRFIVSLAGGLIVVVVLWDVFSNMVVTRRATRQLRLSNYLIVWTRRLFMAYGRRIQDRGRRENFLGIMGPLLLFLRFGVWTVLLIIGYAMLQWGAGEHIASPDGVASASTVLYYSGTTFFTVALGDITPSAAWPRLLNVAEAATGFLFLGLVISYLPTFYSDFAAREARISQLDARAGSPPTAGALLARLGRENCLGSLDKFFSEWETWTADVMESQLSYPILALFRSQHEDQSWVSALATILDASALVMMGIDGADERAARLAFAMARHAAVDLSQTFGQPKANGVPDRLPAPELARLRAYLAANNVRLAEGPQAEARLSHLRGFYEPYLEVLSTALVMPLPTWVPEPDARDNWKRTASTFSDVNI